MIKITAAAPLDLNDLCVIEQQIFASGEDWQLSRRVFSYHLRRGNFLITARENERQATPKVAPKVAPPATSIVGYALLFSRQHSARLYALGVLPNFARRGIGEKLLIATITEAKRQKKKRIYLEVRAQNLAAQTLYKKHGFFALKTLKAYYPHGTDGLKMCKELNDV